MDQQPGMKQVVNQSIQGCREAKHEPFALFFSSTFCLLGMVRKVSKHLDLGSSRRDPSILGGAPVAPEMKRLIVFEHIAGRLFFY